MSARPRDGRPPADRGRAPPTSLWHTMHPSVRVGTVVCAFALALLALKGAPQALSAQAGSASARPAACANCRTEPPPFRMLPSDLESWGTSTHPVGKRSSLLSRTGTTQ